MFVEQRYVLARAKLHFTPVVLTPQAHLQRVEGSKTLSPIAPLGRESNSLAESGVLLEFHPDKQRPDVSEEEAEQHLQRFIDIDQAWKILSNEESRNEYNLQLRACELKQSWPVDAHITLDDMNWDYETECYSYTCRCGGEFILEKDETQEVETVVCCDSCSLSIEVKKGT
nr:dnaJ homolog subfamily C member 24 isoform X1 [Danio rerio]|eukprot:XP_021326139.1 dnaJ homolog subfamily C member 24 isoform X1 [Danio rerio]